MFDAYSRKARLAPAALAALPALVLVGGGALQPAKLESLVAMAFGGVGIVTCGVVRDRGRSLQPGLWLQWGGSPTQRRMRWSSGDDDRQIQRRHDHIAEITGEKLPSRAEEAANPVAADRRYDEAIAILRQLTRESAKFPLVFAENVDYGFRRNCLGVRSIAMTVSLAVLVASVLIALLSGGGNSRYWIAAGAATLCLVAWWRRVNEKWVRSAGEQYADRLIEATASLRPDAARQKKDGEQR